MGLQTKRFEKRWDDLAENYLDEVISPISHDRKRTILKYIEKITDAKDKTAGDLGCGVGMLLSSLAKRFKNVVGIDVSAKMVELAKQNNKKYLKTNLKIDQMGIEDLTKTNIKFDILFAINSIIMPDIKKIEDCFLNIRQCLNEGGLFVGVFPSIESYREEYQYTYLKELDENANEEEVKKLTNQKMEVVRMDALLGLYDTGDMIQKYYSYLEIKKLLDDQSFKIIEHQKITYPHDHTFNYTDQASKQKPPMWDHFVICQKV